MHDRHVTKQVTQRENVSSFFDCVTTFKAGRDKRDFNYSTSERALFIDIIVSFDVDIFN